MEFFQNRWRLLLLIVLVIGIGLASRIFQTGAILSDKYLGDALYAILVYLLITLVRSSQTLWSKAIVAMPLMLAIGGFQLTFIPLQLSQSIGKGELFSFVMLSHLNKKGKKTTEMLMRLIWKSDKIRDKKKRRQIR